MGLLNAFQGYDESNKKINPTYSGLLGLTINGEQVVEHPTRNGFVYFRFRDNLSEVVLAFNDKVSPVYGLAVEVERRGNNWYVIGRDTARYSNWGSSAPYLPKHGFQHSFNRDEGTGGDVVLVYPDQFMPLLVYPSGSFGAGNLQVASYLLQRDSDFIFVGNTGTQNILPYKPTGSSALMGLVYLDTTTGNPGLLINSGTYFNATLTGTAEVSPYIPYPSSTQEPLYAFRLVSGTSALQWENLYNARQFIGGGQGGGSSTGTSIPTGIFMDLLTNQVAAGIKRFSDNIQIGIEPPALNTTGTVSQASEGVGAGNLSWTWATGTAPFTTGIMARGSKASPLAVQKDDILFRWRGRAYDGSSYGNTSVEIRGVADEEHNTAGHGTRLEIYATPTGTTTLTLMATVQSNGSINIGSGTYNINGVPVGSSGGGTVPHPSEGRLTLTSGTPIMSSTVSGSSSIYYTPFHGDLYPSYNGSVWTERTVPELLLALDSNSGHTGYQQSGKNFDLFIYNDGGTDRLGTGPAWTSDTGRGTGAGTTELEYKNGIRTNKVSMTLRFGSASGDTVTVAANRATYVGYMRTIADGKATWELGGQAANGAEAKLYLYNAYNQVKVDVSVRDSTSSWTYNSNTIRAMHGSNTNRISFICESGDSVDAKLAVVASGGAAGDYQFGISLNSTSSFTQSAGYGSLGTFTLPGTQLWAGLPGLGFHFLQACEAEPTTGSAATAFGQVASRQAENFTASFMM